MGRGALGAPSAGGGGCSSFNHSALAQVCPLSAGDDLARRSWKDWFVTQPGENPEARAETDESNSKNCMGHFYIQVALA
jgi:hypothetical protein